MAMSQTWYLKYRPQKIADLDLVAVRQTLGEMLKKDHLPHAWLFVGSRGLGKTSSARILAKAMNCRAKNLMQSAQFEPCNECEICRAITDSSCPDVIEMDAASNRGIDDIRMIREQIGLAPMVAKYKVYIVDEVHMLTTEAANALLKTLEEPPAHALFILCTTEADKLLPTIVSRCAVVTFGRPTMTEIVGKLQQIANGEGLKASPDALGLLANKADGSFRDAVKLFEQVYLQRGKVDTEGVVQVLGMIGVGTVEELVDLIVTGKIQEAIDTVEGLVANGTDMRTLLVQMVEVVRTKLLLDLKHGSQWLHILDKLSQAYVQTRDTVVAQLPLEIAIIELTANFSSHKSQALNPNEVSNSKSTNHKVEVKKLDKVGEKIEMDENAEYKLADLVAKWGEILAIIKPQNVSIEGLLRSTKPQGFDGKQLVLEVFYKFHKDKLETEKCKGMIEGAVEQVFHLKKVRLMLQLGEKMGSQAEVGGKVEDEVIAAAEAVFGVKAV